MVSWNGPRAAVRPQRERLALEHQLADGQRARPLDDLGDALGHVLQLAREDPHLVAGAVHLQPRAVELVLEGRLAQARERLFGVARRGSPASAATGESSRSVKRDSPAAPSSSAARASSPRLPAYIAARRTSSRAAQRAARAIASITSPSSAPWRSSPRQQLHEQRAAGLVGAREEGVQPPQPPLGRAGSLLRGDGRQGLVHVGQRQRCARGGPRRSAGCSVRQPTPMRPWGSTPGEVERRELDLPAAGLAQQAGDGARPSRSSSTWPGPALRARRGVSTPCRKHSRRAATSTRACQGEPARVRRDGVRCGRGRDARRSGRDLVRVAGEHEARAAQPELVAGVELAAAARRARRG